MGSWGVGDIIIEFLNLFCVLRDLDILCVINILLMKVIDILFGGYLRVSCK